MFPTPDAHAPADRFLRWRFVFYLLLLAAALVLSLAGRSHTG